MDKMFLIEIVSHEWPPEHDRYDMFDKRSKYDDRCTSSVNAQSQEDHTPNSMYPYSQCTFWYKVLCDSGLWTLNRLQPAMIAWVLFRRSAVMLDEDRKPLIRKP